MMMLMMMMMVIVAIIIFWRLLHLSIIPVALAYVGSKFVGSERLSPKPQAFLHRPGNNKSRNQDSGCSCRNISVLRDSVRSHAKSWQHEGFNTLAVPIGCRRHQAVVEERCPASVACCPHTHTHTHTHTLSDYQGAKKSQGTRE